MTHRDLVEISYRWVLTNGRVGVAFKELKSISEEIPDVIGFDSWQSVLIECKVSRGDFLRDKNKRHRAEGKGMGNWRFICCPAGLIKPEELPEKWGLIYVSDKGRATLKVDCRVKKTKVECTSEWERRVCPEGFYYQTVRADENRFEADVISERNIMYSALRRLFIKGHINSIYDKQYNKLNNREILKQS